MVVKKKEKGMQVKKGDRVKVEYTGTLEDGVEFDSSKKHDAPLEFEVGDGQVIEGFESAVIGMKAGDEKEVKLPPSEAYGDENPALINEVPKEALPKGQELTAGMMLVASMHNGERIPARITKMSEKTATLDMNHPLAGKTLIFKLKLIEIMG